MLCLIGIIVLGADVKHQQLTVANATLEVVSIAMQSGRFRADVILAPGFPGSDEDFGKLVAKPGLVAAINGAYFDRNSKKPIGDIWAGGSLRSFGAMGTALCIRADGSMDIRRVQRHKRVDWSEFETVLACGPALVLDGRVDCDPGSEGFRDPAVMGRTSRMGLGYTKAGELLLVRCPKVVTFPEFADIMLRAGCIEAMNLDSGASAALWANGKTIVPAGRRLPSVLGVYKR